MFLKARRSLIFSLPVALLFCVAAYTSGTADETDRLDNGLQIILKENHASPLVASVIFVKAGARYESRYETGLTHFLEHLLFDGTVNLTREELDRSISDLGGYINAFTRKDLTAYLVLLPKEYIDYGLTVQADMLFNPVFPEDELAKERKVVIEEINSSLDAPGAPAEAFFTEKAYAGTDYRRPVLGYAEFIENIPRDAIIAYHRKYYRPDRMTMLLIGDFETAEMKKKVASIFGPINPPPDTTPETPTDLHETLAREKHRPGYITGQQRFDTVANVNSTYINFSINAPSLSEPDYLAFDLLTSYLNLDEISPLMAALQSGADPLAEQVSLWLETREDFSRLEISAMTDRVEDADSIVQTVLRQLAEISRHEADPQVLQGIKTSIRCEAIYNAERLHYYSFIIAPLMMTAGWDFIQQYPDLIDTISWDRCSAAAAKWLTEPDYVVTVVHPADSSRTPYRPEGMTAREVRSYFDTTAIPACDVTTGYALTYPNPDSVKLELVDRSVYRREVLANGLTVIVKSNPDSRVFAVNILGRNRTAAEPEGLAGITDFVNRCLEKGTINRTGARLTRDLAAIGANLTLYDNPWIPYDDRYTSRSYSFIKFETIEPFAETGLDLLSDIVLNPAFDPAEVANVRSVMMGVLRREAGSPSKTARNLFYQTLFEGQAFARPVMGTPASLAAITRDDLIAYHHRFYSPENMIVSVVTSRDTAEVMSWVRRQFGPLEPAGISTPSPSAPESVLLTGREDHEEMDKEQIDIYAGGYLPGANHEDAANLTIATSILSDRLFSNLRERQGLAYSTGVGSGFDRAFGWYYLTISTSAENFRRARNGLVLQTEKLILDGPTAEEVRSAKNRRWGSLMRAKLSRINQAYYMGVNEFLGRGTDYDQQLLSQLNDVDVPSIRRVASRHFHPDQWIVVTAGKHTE